ncbi:MAG: WG repeat-containing protein [Microcoleus sp. PH2017_22_RUC_O_B]|uniref:WG repeat-containing protein n=1 Tax=unclassified Microcoleus TaxID=2642155 RepID=UPI001D76DA84|nr:MULTISPECIES: WG repeat-containing protein [unclassified Microcoleus]MCC3532406.1 WG repeat-containing protein [Microcoleus sp. PH2017_21_RUC_O_A]MCC3544691.1 WG repeat-containing protein [Microcoleus sp. PH2017_22_RUC_O_B]
MKKIGFLFCLFLFVLVLTNHRVFGQDIGREIPYRYGFIDPTGKYVIQSQFDSAGNFYDGLAQVRIERGSTRYAGYIDRSGQYVIPPQFDDFSENFSEGLATVKHNGKFGYIDQTGKFVIPPKFEKADSFSEGLAGVYLKKKKGYINKQGEFVIKPKFKGGTQFVEGVAIVWTGVGEQMRLIDKTGEYITPSFDYINDRLDEIFPEFDEEGLARIGFGGQICQQCNSDVINSKWGYIDRTGKIVIPPKFDEKPKPFSDGRASIYIPNEPDDLYMKRSGKYGYIDKTGEFVIPPKYDSADAFSEGLASVGINDSNSSLRINMGYIDVSGKYVIPPPKGGGGRFSEGLAKNINIIDLYGYLDRTGQWAIPPKFKSADNFKDGLAKVTIEEKKGFLQEKPENKYGLIDKTGKYVVEPLFDEIYDFSEGIAAVRLGEKWGYIDRTGKYIAEPQFDLAGKFQSGMAIVGMKNCQGQECEAGTKHSFSFPFQHQSCNLMGKIQGFLGRVGVKLSTLILN